MENVVLGWFVLCALSAAIAVHGTKNHQRDWRDFFTLGVFLLIGPILMARMAYKRSLRRSWNSALLAAEGVLKNEADRCISDIVKGDAIGEREAKARAGALLTAASDLNALRV